MLNARFSEHSDDDAKEATDFGHIAILGNSILNIILHQILQVIFRMAALGEETYEAFVTAKKQEWDDYRIHVMNYEIERYLEVAYFSEQ